MKNQSLSVVEAALQLPKETAPSNSWLAMGKSLPEQVWLLKSLGLQALGYWVPLALQFEET
jgi:hypothetical protein